MNDLDKEKLIASAASGFDSMLVGAALLGLVTAGLITAAIIGITYWAVA